MRKGVYDVRLGSVHEPVRAFRLWKFIVAIPVAALSYDGDTCRIVAPVASLRWFCPFATPAKSPAPQF